MAGRPRTRAKREAERLAAGAIPDAVPLPAGANTPPAARARAKTAPPRIPLSGFVGPQTRAAADDLEMQRLRNVAAQIRPGVTVQIERTRPTWCAGYLEDYPIDDQAESFAELRAYVRDNFGGQRFRLTVLSAQGSVLAEGSFPVAAPPKDRGKPIDRHVWEGEGSEPARAAAPVQVAAAPSSSTDHGLASVVLEMLRDSNRATIESVKEMTKQTREQTADLIKSVVSTRSEERRERTLASQLDEIVGVTKAVDKVQRQLFGSARGGQQPVDLDEAADREATTFFKKAVIGKIFGGVNEERRAGDAGNTQQQQPQRRRVRIPDAGAPTPQPNGKGGN